MLAYACSNFHFDRKLLALNDAVFEPGALERQARLLAPTAEISLIRTSINLLRIRSATDFLLRIGMNLSFVYRLKRLVEVQIARRKTRGVLQRPETAVSSNGAAPQKRVPRWLAVPFALYAVFVVVGTHMSIRSSVAACKAFPECTLLAYRWNTSDLCPCLIMVDIFKAPKTYAEWANPVDKTETVRQLALSRDLRGINLINRRLRELPEELRHCPNMRHLYVQDNAAFKCSSWLLVC